MRKLVIYLMLFVIIGSYPNWDDIYGQWNRRFNRRIDRFRRERDFYRRDERKELPPRVLPPERPRR